jgi:hypothetical protein
VRVVSLVSRCRCVDVSPSGEVTPASARQCRTALWARLAEAVRRRLIRASVRSRFKLTLLARLLPGLTVGKSLDEGLRSSRTKRSLPLYGAVQTDAPCVTPQSAPRRPHKRGSGEAHGRGGCVVFLSVRADRMCWHRDPAWFSGRFHDRSWTTLRKREGSLALRLMIVSYRRRHQPIEALDCVNQLKSLANRLWAMVEQIVKVSMTLPHWSSALLATVSVAIICDGTMPTVLFAQTCPDPIVTGGNQTLIVGPSLHIGECGVLDRSYVLTDASIKLDARAAVQRPL